jgi:hypothetical protein
MLLLSLDNMRSITIVVFAREPTICMDILYEYSCRLQFEFLCISNNPKFPTTSIEYEVKVVPETAEFPEKYLFRSLPDKSDEHFYLRLDSDELLTFEDLAKLKKTVESIELNVVGQMNRLWINKYRGKWFYNSLAKSKVKMNSSFDTQVRLFCKNRVLPDERIHTPGIDFQQCKTLNIDINILHLIYQENSFLDRLRKVVKYEKQFRRAGLGKMRYYLPEMMIDRNIWIPLDAKFFELLSQYKALSK